MALLGLMKGPGRWVPGRGGVCSLPPCLHPSGLWESKLGKASYQPLLVPLCAGPVPRGTGALFPCKAGGP